MYFVLSFLRFVFFLVICCSITNETNTLTSIIELTTVGVRYIHTYINLIKHTIFVYKIHFMDISISLSFERFLQDFLFFVLLRSFKHFLAGKSNNSYHVYEIFMTYVSIFLHLLSVFCFSLSFCLQFQLLWNSLLGFKQNYR